MKVTWEHIVDVARGIASEEIRAAVEASADAMTKVRLLRHMETASAEQAPDLWVSRAKALQLDLPRTKVFVGKLVFEGGPSGFRSGAVLARDLRFEFDGAVIELRIEPAQTPTRKQVVGLFTSTIARTIHVEGKGAKPVACDELGQFEILIDSDSESLQFVDRVSGETFEVEIA